jgi:hypothetical protein
MRNMRHSVWFLVGLLVVAIALFTLTGAATARPAPDLTGTWTCDDGGIYYLRQIGNALWWYGENDQAAPGFSNVAHGAIRGNTITLQWAGVPKGSTTSGGILKLKIVSGNQLQSTLKTGGFGGSNWYR